MRTGKVIGLGGSRAARLAEIAAELSKELGLPAGGIVSAYDFARPPAATPESQGLALPADQPEAFDTVAFFAELRRQAASEAPYLVAILGPLAALREARETVSALMFVEVEERLSLLRWADLLMEAGAPGGVEALLLHESLIVPRYAAWSAGALRQADVTLDDEEGPAALASKIAFYARGDRQATARAPGPTKVPGAAGAAAAAAASPTGSLARMEERMEARSRLEAARALEERLTRARPPNRLGLAWRAFVADTLYPTTKRAMDVGLVSLLLSIVWPIYALVGLLIWMSDPGPLIYTQTRVGRHGRHFRFPKFRSMVMDADKLKDKLLAKNEMTGGITFKMKRDPRVIPIGRVIRKYSLDELPQLWSILRGDLTLVGPRPPVPREVALYSSADRRRLEAVPGLTCIWQVSGRSDIPFPRQVELDVEYLEQRNIILDLRILIATIPAVLTGKGAY